jgi:hypothetical protein
VSFACFQVLKSEERVFDLGSSAAALRQRGKGVITGKSIRWCLMPFVTRLVLYRHT